MHRLTSSLVFSASVLLALGTASAQGTSSNATATCNFDSAKQVAVEYQRIAFEVKKTVLGKEIPYGKAWAPGGKPMTMFTNTPVTAAGKDIPIGAYTLFVIPEEKKWTLIISKSSGKYDEQQDLARIPMQFGELLSPESEFSVYFAHVAPDQCSMRLDVDNVRAWVVISEKK
jgi:Protein of unknown function (DUF2911)